MDSSQTITIIRSDAETDHSIAANMRELWRYRRLIFVLVKRNLRLRYKNSMLGYAWSLINPLMQVFVLTVLVGYILQSGPSNLSAFIMCAYLPWTFFQSAALDSSSALLAYNDIIRKVYFPREILPIVTVLSNGVQFLLTLVIFVVYRWGFLWIAHGWPGWPPLAILWLPVVTALLLALTIGLSFYFAIFTNFMEDVKFILTTLLGLLFYLLPIVYFPENIFYSKRIASEHLRSVYYHIFLSNPLSWIVTAFKQMFFPPQNIANRSEHIVILSAPFDWRYMLICAVISIALFLHGYWFFNKRKWWIVERL